MVLYGMIIPIGISIGYSLLYHFRIKNYTTTISLTSSVKCPIFVSPKFEIKPSHFFNL